MQSVFILSILSTFSLGQLPAMSLLPDLPDPLLMEVKLQDFQVRVVEIGRLENQVLAFAQSIGRQPGLAMEETYRANFDLLITRGFVLSRLVRALDDALRDRKLLEFQRGRYERWLQLARGAVAKSPVHKLAAGQLESQRKEIRDLVNRYTVLCELKRQRLESKLEIESHSMSQEQKTAIKKEMDRLARRVGSYLVVNSAKIESEFSGMDARSQEDEMNRLWREYKVKVAAYRQMQQRAGNPEIGDAMLLSGRDWNTLQRCRKMLDATQDYADQAEVVAANSEHVANLLEEVERVSQLATKNVIMLRKSEKDEEVVVKLRTIFSGGTSAESSSTDDEPLEVPSK